MEQPLHMRVEIRRREQMARDTWDTHPQIREAAALFGISEDEYVYRFVGLFPPIVWVTRTTNNAHMGEDNGH